MPINSRNFSRFGIAALAVLALAFGIAALLRSGPEVRVVSQTGIDTGGDGFVQMQRSISGGAGGPMRDSLICVIENGNQRCTRSFD
ncbi:hypothetical protein [Pseudooceanicola sp.]|uniref:hypothetical protein n=1 Tax=Pseudooceanicola sp. TaxID=1914328 RepID=UPI0026073E57|nr:hypothetical protein [Pseudooceanicola sp.]MDF1854701.1 hypothetical protein [Pseudooceanicola sp.]